MPEVSRLEACLELQFFLPQPPAAQPSPLAAITGISDEVQEIVRLTQIRPERVSWTRNLPAVADELDVTFSASLLPVGLTALEGARVTVWLYEHQQIWNCLPGQPGMFVGLADELSRDRSERTITLRCRDMTAVCLDAKISTAELKLIDISKSASLEGLVKLLLGFAGPFAADWKVVNVSRNDAGSTYAAFLNSEIQAFQKRKGKGSKGKPATSTQRRLRTLDTLADGDETSVWDIICQVCVRLGTVPEVMLGRDGNPQVHLIDALDLQTSDALRPFSRNGRRTRSLTIGQSIGHTSESVRFARNEDLPDQVVVSTFDHETAAFTEGRFPLDAKGRGKEKPKILYQVVEGVSGQQALDSMAAATWVAAQQRQVEFEVETWSPWSDGGGAVSPDLLDLGAGAAMVILSSEESDHAARRELEALDLPRDVIEAFMRAEDRKPPSLMFQVAEVALEYQGGSQPDFSCKMKLNAFLGTQGAG